MKGWGIIHTWCQGLVLLLTFPTTGTWGWPMAGERLRWLVQLYRSWKEVTVTVGSVIERLLLNTMNALKRKSKDICGALIQQFRANCVKRASWAVSERALMLSMGAEPDRVAEPLQVASSPPPGPKAELLRFRWCYTETHFQTPSALRTPLPPSELSDSKMC